MQKDETRETVMENLKYDDLRARILAYSGDGTLNGWQ